jgi:hypothetical protein
MKFPDFFRNLIKKFIFPDISLTGKSVANFPGFP